MGHTAALPAGRQPLQAPWRIIQESWPAGEGDLVLMRLVVVADVGDDFDVVAFLPLSENVGDLMPTAKLIVAAPDLLAFIRKMAAETFLSPSLTIELLQLIAKAEGRLP